METIDFLVDRADLRSTRFQRRQAPASAQGQAVLRVDAFGFSANNVTYAVVGDMMSYWSFFPAETGWGKVPVWGFADVVESRVAGLDAGTRVYGYFPMSTHLVVEPDRVGRGGFVDGAAHRRTLPAVYNGYSACAHDPNYRAEHENALMLFRPLFMTAFVLDDFLADGGFFGARAVVLSSASSKTSFGLAFLLRRRGCEVIGLTSAGNAAFVEGLGCYHRVVTYERIGTLPADRPVAFVDMAGNGAVLQAVHGHFRDNLKCSSLVGVTHWERREPPAELPGPQPTFFFAPSQIEKRTREWGPEGLQQRYGEAWGAFLGFVGDRICVVRGRGEAAVQRIYAETLEGRTRPDEGHILSL